MPSGPVRRAQMIAPFGVGGLTVTRNGTSLISAGLDHWFEKETSGKGAVDRDEFVVEEWRLQRLLDVDYFCLPPDHRRGWQFGDVPNTGLTVPFLRFLQWHFCPSCGRLYQRPLVERDRPRCQDCQQKKRRSFLFQVRFIAMCDQGHIQDFPWREWVHRSAKPTCDAPLFLVATGGASLAGEQIRCACGAQRTLGGIMGAGADDADTTLSSQLDSSGTPFPCQGCTPWLGTDEVGHCARPLRGTLRSASNVYFAQVRSAIYLPRGHGAEMQRLVELLEGPPIATGLRMLSSLTDQVKPELLRHHYRKPLEDFTDAQIETALRIVGGESIDAEPSIDHNSTLDDEDEETAFRRAEFAVLCRPRDDEQLMIREEPVKGYEVDVARHFRNPMLINKLRETRVLAGFTRVYPENEQQTLEQRKALLWRHVPTDEANWLPAYVVYGEGIFLQLREDLLKPWEARADVIARVRPLLGRYRQLQQNRRLRNRHLSPRFILIHTFAHLVMNRLTFECGYSSSALRERLYVSDHPDFSMAGVLIYTAAGDAEGTMGGLVRMGKPGNLEPVIRRALEGALWCSTDPVCMEIGAGGGQGPDSCNLAACHNCALVPETACEEFNRFLDRSVVVGEPNTQMPGFFQGFGL